MKTPLTIFSLLGGCLLFLFFQISFSEKNKEDNPTNIPSKITDSIPPLSNRASSDYIIECPVDHMHARNMRTNPEYQRAFEEENEKILKRIKNKKKNRDKEIYHRTNNPLAPCVSNGDENVITIPVVVYIVHPTSLTTPTAGTDNPTDAQITAGIQHLNDALRNIGAYAGHGHGATDLTNPDRALLESVDTEIQYCLAQRDINGGATNGIFRIPTDTYADIDIDTEIANMKAYVDAQVGTGLFPDSDYAGVWLFSSICSTSDGGCYGGYAGPSLGVLNLADIFGLNTNASTTHIHEFGHYMSVWHPFQGATACLNGDCLTDGDYVCDTPPDDSTSGTACGGAQNTCSTDLNSGPFTVDQDDLYETYMDYSSSSCKNTFTQGQKDRMRASMLGRTSLINSKGCINPNMTELGIVEIVYPSPLACSTTVVPIVEVENNGNTTIASVTFSVSIDGGAASTFTEAVSIAPGTTAQVVLGDVSFTGTGTHSIYIEITGLNGGVADSYIRNNYYCQEFSYHPPITTLDYCEDLETGVFPTEWSPVNSDDQGGFTVSNLTTCAGQGDYQFFLDSENYGSANGETYGVVSPIIDLTNYENVTLDFDYAYSTYYSNFGTGLQVAISADCGTTYTILDDGELSVTATISGQSNSFIPGGCDDWEAFDQIDLSAYSGCDQVLIRFLAYGVDAYWGNNLYLDNICISGTPCTDIEHTETITSPIEFCRRGIDYDLSIDNFGTVVPDPTQEVIGWWVTVDDPISNSVSDKTSAMTAAAGATVGGSLTASANVVYEGDNTNGDYTLTIDCNDLNMGDTYYVTPFVSSKQDEIPTESCTINGTQENTNISGNAGKRSRITPAMITCAPTDPPNPPTFTLTVQVSGYTGAANNLRFILRQEGSGGPSIENTSLAGNGTYVYTEVDFPGYDPGATGQDGFYMFAWENGGNGAQNMVMTVTLDITYPGSPAIGFPTLDFDGCLFGTPIPFVCDCKCNEPAAFIKN